MTLARRLSLTTAVLVVSLLVISVAALWGLDGLSRRLDEALDEYAALRQVYEVGRDVTMAEAMLTAGSSDDQAVWAKLRSAADKLRLFTAGEAGAGLPTPPAPPSPTARQRAGAAALTVLQPLLDDLAAGQVGTAARPTTQQQLAVIKSVLNQLAQLASETSRAIKATQEAANTRRRVTIGLVAGLSLLVVVSAVVIGVWQYRGVMTPLGRLRRGVRQIAAGRLSGRLEPERDREFAELADDFNRMAGELDSLYRELEEKVAARSKELVRSERLASVGFLAAGVAHEINNPLGIMSGHAELALRGLDRGPDGKAIDETKTALRVICDEAFRCKDIIQKLLSLTRPGDEQREQVSIGSVVRDVATMVSGLKRFRDRKLEVNLPEADELRVMGNETELKQVLLNLTVNALDAVDPGGGQVVVDAQRDGPTVRLHVSDNGRGMTPDVLDRVFEPFFTQKRGAGGAAGGDGAGTGLGLSITHVIVEQHGGRVSADSDGPGRGSRFTVELPAANGAA